VEIYSLRSRSELIVGDGAGDVAEPGQHPFPDAALGARLGLVALVAQTDGKENIMLVIVIG
jgi:hypothetical protein